MNIYTVYVKTNGKGNMTFENIHCSYPHIAIKRIKERYKNILPKTYEISAEKEGESNELYHPIEEDYLSQKLIKFLNS